MISAMYKTEVGMMNGKGMRTQTMKKIGIVCMVLLCAAAMVSCEDQLIPDEPVKQGVVDGTRTFKAIIEQRTSETKTLLNGTQVVWSDGDQIRVFNSTNPNGVVYTLKSGVGQWEAVFTGGDITGAGPFYYIYPAQEGTLTGNKVSLTVPAAQSYASNSFGLGANIAAGYSATLENLSFKNVGGLLLLNLSGDKSVKTINLYPKSSETLNGNAEITIPDADYPTMAFSSGQSDESFQKLTLDCGSGVAASSGKFYVAVPAGAFSGGFAVEIIDTEGNAMIKYSQAGGNSISRSAVRSMPEIAYTAQYKGVFLASTAEAGAFTGAAADGTLNQICVYPGTAQPSSQYVYSTGASTNTYRIQNWTVGYALSITTPQTLTVGKKATVSIDALGSTGDIATVADAEMHVIKTVGKRVWITHGSNGYIITLNN